MKDKLDILKNTFGSFLDVPETHPTLEAFKKNCLVVLPAGGESSRFKPVTGNKELQKSAYVLPNGETMLERVIAMYSAFGLKRFLVLLYHYADSVEKMLGDGSAKGISITYSYDPERPVGKGGAIRHAFEQGLIKKDEYFIVHNPDDQLVKNANDLLKKIIVAHLSHEEHGAKATAVTVEGAEYAYSALAVDQGKVTDASMYPFIPIPTHAGITIFSPKVVAEFGSIFDLSQKTDFESVLFPKLVREKALFAVSIPKDSWVPVNDEKGLKKLLSLIG